MDFDRRLTRMETALHYELERVHSRLEHLEHEMTSRPFQHLGEALTGATLLKLLAAICLPLLVLLVTGDPHKAVAVAKMLPGG